MPVPFRVAYPSGFGWAPRKIPLATRPTLVSPGRPKRCSESRTFRGRKTELPPTITPREEGLPGAAAGPGDTPGGASSPNRRRRAATLMVRPAKDPFPIAVSSMTMDSTILFPLLPIRYTLLRTRQGVKRVSLDPNPPAPLPAIGQPPVRKSDKQRLAFRTDTDTEGRRTGLLWEMAARDDHRAPEGRRDVLGPDIPWPIGKKEKDYAVDSCGNRSGCRRCNPVAD